MDSDEDNSDLEYNDEEEEEDGDSEEEEEESPPPKKVSLFLAPFFLD